jgi:hypothetical protein
MDSFQGNEDGVIKTTLPHLRHLSADGLVDEDALLTAFRSGQVAAAGLDSFAVEPLPEGHPFRAEPRIVLTPHIGGVTADAYIARRGRTSSRVWPPREPELARLIDRRRACARSVRLREPAPS